MCSDSSQPVGARDRHARRASAPGSSSCEERSRRAHEDQDVAGGDRRGRWPPVSLAAVQPAPDRGGDAPGERGGRAVGALDVERRVPGLGLGPRLGAPRPARSRRSRSRRPGRGSCGSGRVSGSAVSPAAAAGDSNVASTARSTAAWSGRTASSGTCAKACCAAAMRAREHLAHRLRSGADRRPGRSRSTASRRRRRRSSR